MNLHILNINIAQIYVYQIFKMLICILYLSYDIIRIVSLSMYLISIKLINFLVIVVRSSIMKIVLKKRNLQQSNQLVFIKFHFYNIMYFFKKDNNSQKQVSKILEDCLQRYNQFIRRDICRRHQKLPRDSSNKQMIVCKFCKRNYMATNIGKKIQENMNKFQVKFKNISFYINQLIKIITLKKQNQVSIYEELIKDIHKCATQYINSIKGLNQSTDGQQIKDELKQDNYKCALYLEAIQAFYKTYIDNVNQLSTIYLKDIFKFFKDTCKIKLVQFFQKSQAIDLQASKKFRQQQKQKKKKSQFESNVLITIPSQQNRIIKQQQQKIYNLQFQNIDLKKKLQFLAIYEKDITRLSSINKSQSQQIKSNILIINSLQNKIKDLESLVQNNQSTQNYKKLLEKLEQNQKQLNLRLQHKVNECELIKKNHIQTIAGLQNIHLKQTSEHQKICQQNKQKLRIVQDSLQYMKKQKQEVQQKYQKKCNQDMLKIQNLTKQNEKNKIQLCIKNERLILFQNKISQNIKKIQILQNRLKQTQQQLMNAHKQSQLQMIELNNEQVKLKNIQQCINKIQELQNIVNQLSQNIKLKSNQAQHQKLKLQESEQYLAKVKKQSQQIQNQYNKKLIQSTQNINKVRLLQEKLKQSVQNIKIKQEKLKQNEQLLVKANKQSQQIQKQSQINKLGYQQLSLKNIQHINKIQALQLNLKQSSQNLFIKTNQVQILKKKLIVIDQKHTKQYTQNINNIKQLKEKLVQSNKRIEIKSVQAQRLNNKLKIVEQQLIDAKKQYNVLQQKFNSTKQNLQNNIQRISFQKNQKQIALNKTIKKMENDSIEKKKSYEQNLYQIMEYQKIWTNLLNNSQIQTLFKMLRKRISFSRISLIFTASQHEFSSERFHRLCDNKSQLLVIGKCTNGKIFGGFCFPCFGNFEQNDCSFIFSITHKVDFNVKPGKKSTCLDLVYGPIFGDSDFKIKERKVNTNYHIYKNSYEKIENFPISPKQVLCGETQAEILDYEVHKVILSDKI